MRAPTTASVGRRALLAAATAISMQPFVVPLRAALAVEAKSPLIGALSNTLPSEGDNADPLDAIAWDAPKTRGLTTEAMATRIGEGLGERAWFVTGRGLPQFFSEKFAFSDPDVSVDGIEPYCRQVRRLFDHQTAVCEIVCCAATAANTITVIWRA